VLINTLFICPSCCIPIARTLFLNCLYLPHTYSTPLLTVYVVIFLPTYTYVHLFNKLSVCHYSFLHCLQVPTALLLSGVTLTLLTLGQTLVCTARLQLIPINAHVTNDNHAVQFERAMAAKRKTKYYYSSHSFVTRMSFSTYSLVHNGIHSSVVRIFMGLS